MGFDLANLLAEGRVRADVAGDRPGGADPVDRGASGVDPVDGDHGVDLVEVGRRPADPGASAGPVSHNAPKSGGAGRGVRAAASAASPVGEGPADPRVDDTIRPVDLAGPQATSKSRPASAHQDRRISGVAPPVAAEPERRPFDHPFDAASWLEDHTRSKNSRAVRPRSQGPVLEEAHLVGHPADFDEERRLTVDPGQWDRGGIGAQQGGDRGGVEGQGDRRALPARQRRGPSA